MYGAKINKTFQLWKVTDKKCTYKKLKTRAFFLIFYNKKWNNCLSSS